ncbi:MAG: hypothetical protein J6T16_06915 [Opitutales bacterium]|nr:hypothetical protein [Opitutales bacterium]
MKKFFCISAVLFCVCIAAVVAHKFISYCRAAQLFAEREWLLLPLFEKDFEALGEMERESANLFDLFFGRAASAKIPAPDGRQNTRDILESYKNEVLFEGGGGLPEIYAGFFAKLKANKDGFAAVFSGKFLPAEKAAENSRVIVSNTDFCLEYFCDKNSFEKAAAAAAMELAKSLNSDLEKWGARFAANPDIPQNARFADFVVCQSAASVAPPDFPEFCAAAERAMGAAAQKAKKAFLERAQGCGHSLNRLHKKAYVGAFLVYFE